MFEYSKTKHKSNLISLVIFIVTLAIVFLNVLSVIFPSLLVRLTSNFEDDAIHIFQLGMWAVPLLSTNLIILGIVILYYKQKLPSMVVNALRFIFNFEISKRTAIMVFLVLLTILVVINLGNVSKEETWADWSGRKYQLEHYQFNPLESVTFEFTTTLTYASLAFFKNPRIIPFIASICLFITTYFFTVKLSKKRFAGIISLVILLQSNLLSTYSASATYPNYWILLYLISLYLIYNKWYLSPMSFAYSVFAKGLSEAFLPMTFFFILRSEISKRRKIFTIAIYVSFIIFVIYLGLTNPYFYRLFPHPRWIDRGFWAGLAALPYELRYDGLILNLLLPLIVGLYLAARKGIANADLVLFLIFGQLLSSALLIGLTILTLEPYRDISLLVFFAIGVGVIFSNKTTLKT